MIKRCMVIVLFFLMVVPVFAQIGLVVTLTGTTIVDNDMTVNLSIATTAGTFARSIVLDLTDDKWDKTFEDELNAMIATIKEENNLQSKKDGLLKIIDKINKAEE